MAWTTDLVLIVRVLISDVTVPQTYTDTYLQRVLIAAGYIVDSEVQFPYTYSYDISALTISPDPVTNNDLSFIALIPLKAACILTQGAFQQALGQGIKVRDGDSAIDTSVSFRGYRDILELGPCAAYEKLKKTLLASSVGKAVLGPYRTPTGSALDTISWYYNQFASTGRRDRS
jgi:hypothetical protein